MKRNFNDRLFIEKVSALSGKDRNVVNDVFQSLIIAVAMEIYQNEYKHNKENQAEFTIPYVGTISINFYNKELEKGKVSTIIESKITPSPALEEEVKDILEGNISQTQKMIKKRIQKILLNKLEIEDIEIEEE